MTSPHPKPKFPRSDALAVAKERTAGTKLMLKALLQIAAVFTALCVSSNPDTIRRAVSIALCFVAFGAAENFRNHPKL